jgi:nucleoside-diphosphate-sugar epimerase
MKILITGGAGYIGNVLIDKLQFLSDFHYDSFIIKKLTVLDNLMYKQNCLAEHCYRNNFEFVYGDVRNESLFKKLINEHDIIIHLAAYVGMPLCNRFPAEATQTNYESSHFLAKNLSTQLAIYPTTNSGYGTVNNNTEFCTEETPLNPISVYGKTKCDAEKALLDTGKAISLRLATVFGVSKRMRLDLLVNDFTYRAYTDKYIVLFESHFMRNYIHIKDIASTFVFCLKNSQKMINNAFNVGNDSINMSKLSLCNTIKKYVPDFYITESNINEDPDKRNYIVSNKKLQLLKWNCQYDLDFGIKELLKAYSIIKNTGNKFSNV